MPTHGNAYPYTFKDRPGVGGGSWVPPGESFAIGIGDSLKVWALLENEQIPASRTQAAGYVIALEL